MNIFYSNFLVICPIPIVQAGLTNKCNWDGKMRWACGLITIVISSQALAGVPQFIDPQNAEPIAWKTPEKIKATFENGKLGMLNNAQARALVEAMMSVWNEVDTSVARFVVPARISEDVNSENINEYVNGTVCTAEFPPSNRSSQIGESPIVFDDDGAIMDLIGGEGASKKIVGKSAYRCFSGTIDNPLEATQAFAIFNGKFINGGDDVDDLDVNVYAGIILHELGHFLGLHHSMVNEVLFEGLIRGERPESDDRFIPVMYPLVLRGSLASTVLKPDDIAAISALYPTKDAKVEHGEISGVIFDKAGVPVRGANVVARRTSDPLCYAVSAISGRYCAPLVDEFGRVSFLSESCDSIQDDRGLYRIRGLDFGEYTVEVSEISTFAGGDKSMFPKEGSHVLPGPAEYYNSDDVVDENALLSTSIKLSSGTVVTDKDVHLGNFSEGDSKSIDIRRYSALEDSKCGYDPVNYREYLASVAAEQTAGVISSSDDNIDASNSFFDSLSSDAVGGCTLLKVQHSSDMSFETINIGISIIILFSSGLLFVRYRKKPLLLIILATVIYSPFVNAASVVPATTEELASMAGNIFHGTCENVEIAQDERGLIVQKVTYRIHRIIKGDAVDSITFNVVASPDSPNFKTGSEDVLFLYPASKWGYTSTVAGTYGNFPIQKDKSGSDVVRNPFIPSQSVAKSLTTSTENISPSQLLDQFSNIIKRQAP